MQSRRAPPAVRKEITPRRICNENRPQPDHCQRFRYKTFRFFVRCRTYVCAVPLTGRNPASIPQDMATWHLAEARLAS